MRLEVVRHARVGPEAVWQVLTTWERQPEWMLDAKAVEVLTPLREGVGVTIRCPTNLLGVTVQDVMRVTAWDPPRRLAVEHLGSVITGVGAFELEPGAGRHACTWWEEVEPPLGRLGAWGAETVVLPVLRRVFARSLRNLTRLAERQAGAGRAGG